MFMNIFYTFREVFEKQIVDVDEELDEIIYDVKSTFTFDKYASLNISKRDTVTILNPAYIGTISMASIIG